MSLENISPEEIVKLEIGTGEPIVFNYSNEEKKFQRSEL
jgi:bisphosphoglycerate-dependent phosphoglycerate mutase